jgi:hypothetical protein
MNSVEEIKLIKRQFNFILDECKDKISLLKLYDNINKPYFNVINAKKQISQEIDRCCSNDVIKEINQDLDYKFQKIQKIKNCLALNDTQYSINDLNQVMEQYYNLKITHQNITYQRAELQCKYGYLKNILPKVEKTLIKLKSKIGRRINDFN